MAKKNETPAPTQHDAPKPKRTVDRSIEGKLARIEADRQALIDRTLTRKSKAIEAKEKAEAIMLQCDADLRKLGYAGRTGDVQPLEYPEA